MINFIDFLLATSATLNVPTKFTLNAVTGSSRHFGSTGNAAVCTIASIFSSSASFKRLSKLRISPLAYVIFSFTWLRYSFSLIVRSKQTTLLPSLANLWTQWLPMNPQPPVTIIVKTYITYLWASI